MAMDTEKMTVPHFGKITDAVPYEEAVAQSGERVLRMPAAGLKLSVEFGGKTYVCTKGGHPRLIESGRFLQRSDVEGLVFESADGEVLPAECRLEIIAWPDWLSFILDVTPREEMRAAKATIRFGTVPEVVEKSSAASVWEKGETQTVSAVVGIQSSGDNGAKARALSGLLLTTANKACR